MPEPKRYTVRDPETGRTITFAWSGDAPPTDDDMAEVFAAAPVGEPPLTRERPRGETERGNIDLSKRPTVRNPDGSISTVRSLGVNIDGREVLIPTVSDDGRVLSDEDAIALYQKSGRHLGMFDTPENATAYAEQLHEAQSRQYGSGPGHHPDTLARERFGKRIPSLQEIGPDDVPSDAAFLKRGPEVGGAAGMLMGGPAGAGVGAALGSVVKGQYTQGAHVPTSGEVGGAAMDGGLSALLAGAPRMLTRAAGAVGPMVAKHAGALSRGASALTGGGTWLASGNPLMGLGAGAAMKAVTSPGAIKAAGNVATKAGSIPAHAANKTGFGLLSANAMKQALLDALAQEPEQP